LVQDGAKNNEGCYNILSNDPELNVVLQISCINHKIHNLLYTDVLIPKNFRNDKLKNLTSKLNAIYRKLYYRKKELEKYVKECQSLEIWKRVLKFLKENEDNDHFEDILNLNNEEDDIDLDLNKKPDFKSLKRGNVTRWNSTLTMLKSFESLHEVVNKCLEKESLFDLRINEDELKFISDLVGIFSIFETAVKVFQVVMV